MSQDNLKWNFNRKELKMIADALKYYYFLTGDNEKEPVKKLIARIAARKGITT